MMIILYPPDYIDYYCISIFSYLIHLISISIPNSLLTISIYSILKYFS